MTFKEWYHKYHKEVVVKQQCHQLYDKDMKAAWDAAIESQKEAKKQKDLDMSW